MPCDVVFATPEWQAELPVNDQLEKILALETGLKKTQVLLLERESMLNRTLDLAEQLNQRQK